MRSRVMQYLSTVTFLLIVMVFFISCEVEREDGRRSLYEQEVVEKEDPNSLNLLLSYVSDDPSDFDDTDLERIKKRGKLVALTGYGPTSYFVYKGTPMGFEHDLLKLLAKDLGVKLEIVVVPDMDRIIEMLNNGEGDIIADDLTITKDKEALVDFTDPILKTRQVLVQRKPNQWKSMDYQSVEKKLLRSPEDLIGKRVYVKKESVYYTRLQNLSEEVGGDIEIMDTPAELETETLVAMVSEGKISYTIADENSAMILSSTYPNIDVQTPISFEQRIAWAVREDSPLMLEKINTWLAKVKKDGRFKAIYSKYYRARIGAEHMVRCRRDSVCGRRISSFDELIVQHAARIGWDWRLLASLVYQESQFNPKAKSWAGACGLMQLMPGTAQHFGVLNREDPIQSLTAGTKYLQWLDKYWIDKVPDEKERLKFVMASYNVGQEHVADAQRLATKYHKNPQVWDDNVAYFLLQKSTPRYSHDPVVKFGYCRGSEPYDYVINILERYEHYKKLIKEEV